MAAPEREARRIRLEGRLVGIAIEGPLEPSHALVDLLVECYESNTLSYIPWTTCTARHQELELRVKKKSWAPDSAGVIKEKVIEQQLVADVVAGIDLDHALQRRGLAAEMAGLVRFEDHEKIRRRLMGALTEPPVDSRYSRPSLEQLQACDKWIFRKIAQICRVGIQPDTGGIFPLGCDHGGGGLAGARSHPHAPPGHLLGGQGPGCGGQAARCPRCRRRGGPERPLARPASELDRDLSGRPPAAVPGARRSSEAARRARRATLRASRRSSSASRASAATGSAAATASTSASARTRNPARGARGASTSA